jgi:hypothetical protein
MGQTALESILFLPCLTKKVELKPREWIDQNAPIWDDNPEPKVATVLGPQ